ncbi:MAG: crossover junction endodeoxyribonuclease RuvC [Candidatus Riflebacteria bacterium]|nr:crossover junction endodeoxyribonuclease RuvC [Candidatus Riflebacteria bacterium]
MSIILGLDLAERTGICILEMQDHRLLWSETVRLATRDPQARLLSLKDLLTGVIERFGSGEMAIEDVFLPARTSPRTPISLGELRGVARLCAAEHKMPVFFYPPARMKLAITGSGRAEKADVIQLIEAEFGIKVSDDNQADAIGIAYTHWLTNRLRNAVDSVAKPDYETLSHKIEKTARRA